MLAWREAAGTLGLTLQPFLSIYSLMARPQKISDAQVLSAAREVFLERGIQATTAEVARRAGVAEGSIFKRFPTKFDLFRLAMDFGGEEPPWLANLGDRVGQGDIQDTLLDLATEMVSYFRRIAPLMMMRWSNAEATGCGPMPSNPALRRIKKLAGYFEAEMRIGRIRRHDPEILARAFAGSLHNFVFLELLAGSQEELPLPAEMYVRGLVRLFWTGAAPKVEE